MPSLEQLAYLATILGVVAAGLWTLWCAIRKANKDQTESIFAVINESRTASEDGRRRLHDKLESSMAEVRAGFVSREVHDLNLKLLHNADTELSQQVNSIAARLDARCHLAPRGD